jgi:hypothetical protein
MTHINAIEPKSVCRLHWHMGAFGFPPVISSSLKSPLPGIPTSLNNSQNTLFTLTCPGSSTNSSKRRLVFFITFESKLTQH